MNKFERRTIELELLERLISGAMLALDSDVMEAMKNATPEARVDMFFTCITDKANEQYLKGELNEKQYLEAIGGSNTSALFKECAVCSVQGLGSVMSAR